MDDSSLIRIPVIALRGLTVLPGVTVSIDINRKKSIAALEEAMNHDQMVGLFSQKNPEDADPDFAALSHIGTWSKIRQIVKMPGGSMRVIVEGRERLLLVSLEKEGKNLLGEVCLLGSPEREKDQVLCEAMLRILKEEAEKYGQINPAFAKDLLPSINRCTDLEELMLRLAGELQWDYKIRQEYLEADTAAQRYQVLVSHLNNEVEVGLVRRELAEKVKKNVDQNQREYVLREQLKVIREELGESPLSDADEFEKKLNSLKADAGVKEKIRKEIDRFRAMPGGSQEANVLRIYIETVLELPWKKVSRDNNDIGHAEKILNEDHYGLEKVKERVLEYLAVRILTKKGTSPILCLVGPPGTGKTSVARSVARALGKKYVRISLGGIRDEAEIRGHRRTYVGAMPGRIVEGLKQAGTANPLMLLDEIDKVSSDYRGETASALLEVLDGEQNVKFRDHYVEIPIDLSSVLFIATANTTQSIPAALLDRMELIEVSSYTENEKFHIAKDYLVEKQLTKNGLTAEQLTFTDRALRRIIHNYTREAGVRGLERRIGEICRKTARAVLENKKTSVRVTESSLAAYLGKEKISFEDANEKDEVGVACGLAWTSVGGDTLQIEVNVMPGKGNLLLTGQMGDVMKESAKAALTCVRSLSEAYEVPDDYFEKRDIHIHIPEGAVPKDGPSAGITMATAMLSAVTGKKVKAKLAMTGEITLRGRVLPIGGLKEKLLAARMAGIKTVLVPGKNRPDVAELSKEITRGLTICYVTDFKEVAAVAFAQETAV